MQIYVDFLGTHRMEEPRNVLGQERQTVERAVSVLRDQGVLGTPGWRPIKNVDSRTTSDMTDQKWAWERPLKPASQVILTQVLGPQSQKLLPRIIYKAGD